MSYLGFWKKPFASVNLRIFSHMRLLSRLLSPVIRAETYFSSLFIEQERNFVSTPAQYFNSPGHQDIKPTSLNNQN